MYEPPPDTSPNPDPAPGCPQPAPRPDIEPDQLPEPDNRVTSRRAAVPRAVSGDARQPRRRHPYKGEAAALQHRRRSAVVRHLLNTLARGVPERNPQPRFVEAHVMRRM